MQANTDSLGFGRLLGAVLALLSGLAMSAGQTAVYGTAEAAVSALLAAAEEGGDSLRAVLGPEVDELGSGDPVADRLDLQLFVEVAAQGTALEPQSEQRLTLLVGPERYPFPIPLVREGEGWRFATEDGKEELINRRIGRNELHAIASINAYVEAQYEYSRLDPTGTGPQFAQRFRSSEGKRDGLYWKTASGEADSPMGSLVADAAREGYAPKGSEQPTAPYHGYIFKILTAQGAAAPGGAISYIDANGHMSRGFALLAYPSRYGYSGIMSFLVNKQGILFQKDLGPDTGILAPAIDAYNPDTIWEPAAEMEFLAHEG